MKLGSVLKNSNGERCTVVDAPDPPKKWTIKFEDGKTRLRTKSKLKKYYKQV